MEAVAERVSNIVIFLAGHPLYFYRLGVSFQKCLHLALKEKWILVSKLFKKKQKKNPKGNSQTNKQTKYNKKNTFKLSAYFLLDWLMLLLMMMMTK